MPHRKKYPKLYTMAPDLRIPSADPSPPTQPIVVVNMPRDINTLDLLIATYREQGRRLVTHEQFQEDVRRGQINIRPPGRPIGFLGSLWRTSDGRLWFAYFTNSLEILASSAFDDPRLWRAHPADGEIGYHFQFAVTATE